MDGTAEVMLTRDPASHPMGQSIDWLPDGRLLTTGAKLERQEPDGSMVTIARKHANEIVVDAVGNAYVNGADFAFVAGAPPEPGYIKLVTPDGHLRQVADDIQFPNGMVITPDGRTLIISESFAGRLTAFGIDSDGGLSGRRVFAKVSARTASPWTPRARCGCPQAGSRSSVSPRAAGSCSGSDWPRTGRRSR